MAQVSADLLDLDMSQMSTLLRKREVSAVALTQAALDRASQTQPALNAFVSIEPEAALEQARARDTELAAGIWRGPLHGIPLAHKDCFQRSGRPMSLGSAVPDPTPEPRTATALTRLEEAGAVTIGALSLAEMVANPTGQNPHFGDCCNAWDPARISGGSSSGSGPAVACGAVFASLGTDTGGSVRIPASVNGLFGLKPTYGRISRFGCFPRAYSLDCAGPLARTAKDCALLLQAVSGPDAQDRTTLGIPVPDYGANIEGESFTSRIAILEESNPGMIDAEVERIFAEFAATAAGLFGSAPRRSADLNSIYTMGDLISKVEAATMHGRWMRERSERYSQAVFSRTEPGFHIPAVRYAEALAVRGRILAEFLDSAIADIDILLCPATPVKVPLRTEVDMEQKGKVFGVVSQLSRLTRPFSYLGLPALIMPIGLDSNGMPVGVQLIGRPFSELRLLAFAHRMSREIGWKLRPSSLVTHPASNFS